MAALLVTDDLWAIVEPLLPKHEPSPKGGHPRVPDRVCLTGILFVLKTGLPWEDFPLEMGCCGMTLWNRLEEWRRAGVWDELHRVLLGKLRKEDRIDFSRVVVDSSSVRAMHGGKKRDRAQWTAEKQAPSTTWPSTPTERRWRPRSLGPTATT
jgi:transposase